MSEGNEELIASFVEEAQETLADIENDFLAIEEQAAQPDNDLINKVFRGIHSMKGSAGFLGLKSIGTLAHEMENVLNLIRGQELKPTSAVVDALLRGADALRTMICNIQSSNEFDVSQHTRLLQSAVSQDTSIQVQAAMNRDVDIALPDGRLAFVMIKEMDLALRQKQNMHIYVAEADFFADVQARGRTPLDFIRSIHEQIELIDSYVSTAGIGDLDRDLPDSISFMMLLGTRLNAEELADHLQLPLDRVYHIADPEQCLWEPTGPVRPEEVAQQTASGGNDPPPSAAEASAETAAPDAVPAAVAANPTAKNTPANAPMEANAADASNSDSGSPEQTTLRVNVKVLDSLMNLAGELVLGRNQLLQVAGVDDNRGINSVAARIDQVTSELQEAIMQTRMQPIGTVFNKFPRIVRDMSHTLGKQCELTVQGKNVEMDKTIIEAIGDPLTHLIRNSVDHGIEAPADRTARGKNPVGNILLKAYHQAGKVNIAIEDDGAGIDPKRLKEKAVAKGILTADQAQQLSDRETIRLIFHPGFSTAEKVTAVSGRGVGMDVVKTNIERLGGTVEIDTKVGSGTTIQIRLPLTLAIIPCLIVRSGANRYAIPQVNISELVRIRSDEVTKRIDHIKNAEVLRLRGHLLPLVRLEDVLDQPAQADDDPAPATEPPAADLHPAKPSESADAAGSDRPETDPASSKTCSRAINVIVVESGHLRYGLIVRELFDSKEIVVKPLGRHLKECQSLAGATILGDGKVSLILDVAGIAARCKLVTPETDTVTEQSKNRAQQKEESQSVLIFTNHPDEYFGFPSEFIARIERVRLEQIDSVGGQEVLQYRGASLPLIRLEHRIKAEAPPDKPDLYVIVFRVHQREIGLIVPSLVDIRQLPMALDTQTFAEPGVAGSLINEGKNIRLIDMYELVKNDLPSSSDESDTANAAAADRNITILLAEDSTFFRQQMTHILQEDGLSVVACPDGLQAWQALQHPDQVVDLVITDIEMPNMNGLELANKIKTDPCFAHLPVIAVSSLASELDIRRGHEAGVDEYQIKMDREALREAIHRHLEQSRHNAGLSASSRQSPRGVSP